MLLAGVKKYRLPLDTVSWHYGAPEYAQVILGGSGGQGWPYLLITANPPFLTFFGEADLSLSDGFRLLLPATSFLSCLLEMVNKRVEIQGSA